MRAAHAELVELLRDRKALHALLDDKRRDAARVRFDVGLRIDDERVAVRAVGDPHLRAVEHVVVALFFGAQLHADDVRAGVRLAHRERADMLAGHELRQILLLLRFRAVAMNLVHAQIRMRAVRQPDRRRRARDFFHRDHVRGVAHVRAAVFLGDRHAEHAEIAELLPQVHRELVGVVDFGGARRDFLRREIGERVAQHVDVFAQREIQAGHVAHECLLQMRCFRCALKFEFHSHRAAIHGMGQFHAQIA